MTKLELQNKIATLEKNISLIKNPALLANIQKNLKDAKEKLAALEKGTPAPAPSGGSSELEKLYAQREVLKKNLSSENPVVQKTAKTALPKVEARIAELEGASPAPAPSPAPAKRGRKPKAETPAGEPKKRGRKPKAEAPAGEPKKRGRKPKAETPAEEKPKIRRGRKPKAETPAEVPVAPVRRGRKPKAPTETPAKAPAKRGRPALPKGARSQEVSIDSLTKLGNAIVMFCNENGIESPTLADVKEILYILDKRKALRYAKGGKISKSGSYLSKWQIKQILTDGGMKIGSDEILSGIWLKKKDSDVAQMRMGGGVGYFVIDDDILDSGKSVMLGNRRISAKNKKFQGVFQGKMVGGVMKVYDYDDEMWKAVNPDEWQQAYAEGGGIGSVFSRAKGFGKIALDKGVALGKSAKQKTQKAIHESKKKIALDVLWEVKKKLAKGRDENIAIEKAFIIVKKKYENGGGIYAEGGGLGTNFNIVYEKPNDDIAYKETINANSPREARNKFYAKHPTCTILSLSEEYAKGGGVDSSTITDLEDFDPETTLVFDGDANFEDFPEITYLGNLQIIKGDGNFRNSQVQDLGNLQTIGGSADFMNSRVEHLGNLQTIGGSADFEDSEVQNLGNLQTIGGNANFENSEIRNLGKLQTIGHTAFFQDSQVQNLGNLQTIGGSAFFENSIVKRLGNLQTIGGRTFFGNRTDLEAEWEQKQKGNNYAKGGGVYTSDKIFVLEVRDGETDELLEEEVYRANNYSTALLYAEYDEDLFKKKYGDYLHFKLREG